MIQQVKENLFTIPGIITTFIHVFVIVGAITSFVVFETQVMGIDPMAQVQQSKGAKR